jgi:hypothetical protein
MHFGLFTGIQGPPEMMSICALAVIVMAGCDDPTDNYTRRMR